MEWTNMVVHIVCLICITAIIITLTIKCCDCRLKRKTEEIRQNTYREICGKIAPERVRLDDKQYTIEYDGSCINLKRE